MSSGSIAVVILAAGKGTRMKSALPKVLHQVAGKAMVQHVVDAATSLAADNTVIVYGHGGDKVKSVVNGDHLQWAEQAEQLGTGHAVAQAMPLVKEDIVLVLYGDVPLIRPETLREFVQCVDDQTLALMTLTLDDHRAYILIDCPGWWGPGIDNWWTVEPFKATGRWPSNFTIPKHNASVLPSTTPL